MHKKGLAKNVDAFDIADDVRDRLVELNTVNTEIFQQCRRPREKFLKDIVEEDPSLHPERWELEDGADVSDDKG
jgi:hypothetical protein